MTGIESTEDTRRRELRAASLTAAYYAAIDKSMIDIEATAPDIYRSELFDTVLETYQTFIARLQSLDLADS